MKFIHLADLHLGKSVLEAPMLEDQRLFLDGVLETAVEPGYAGGCRGAGAFLSAPLS